MFSIYEGIVFCNNIKYNFIYNCDILWRCVFLKHINESIKQLADDFIGSLPCQSTKPHPSAEITCKNERIANMLLDAFANGGSAEFTAIAQYLNHSDTIDDEETSEMLFCIALVEMEHLDMVSTMIVSLGGNLRVWNANKKYWSGGNVSYGKTTCEKLSLDIMSEEDAIAGYEQILRNISCENGAGAHQVEAVIKRIIEDEKFHLDMFKNAYQRCCCTGYDSDFDNKKR